MYVCYLICFTLQFDQTVLLNSAVGWKAMCGPPGTRNKEEMCFCYSAIVNCVLNHLLCMQKDISNISKQGWGASWQKPWRMIISLYQV